MIILRQKKSFVEIQQAVMEKKKKTLRKLGVEGNFLDIIKGISEKSTTTIIFNNEIMMN